MKKRIAVLLALMIGFTYWPSAAVVMAAGNEEPTKVEESKEVTAEEENEKNQDTTGKEAEDTETENSFLNNLLSNFFGGKDEKEASNENSEKKQNIVNKKSVAQENSGLKNLQIPQKLNVVIDPWEMDQKGQVYSEQYIISNTGDVPGILTLSNLACRPREQSGVIVRTDKAGLHDSGDKSIYIEMLFGNGEQIVFSQESSQYQTELKPGEELSICFAGEVNENAFGKWENNDVTVSVVYSWEMEEERKGSVEETDIQGDEKGIKENTQSVIDEKESGKQTQEGEGSQEKTELNEEKSAEKTEIDPEKGKIEEEKQEQENLGEQKTEAGTAGSEQELSASAEASPENPADQAAGGIQEQEMLQAAQVDPAEENLDAGREPLVGVQNPVLVDQEKNEVKNIELQEPQKVDVAIDSWKVDEKGRIVSPQYLFQNTGNATGIWDLSEILCKPREQSEVAIKTDKNGLHEGDEKAVFMELVLGNGDKVVLSQESSQYKVELKPGEKLSVRFVGEMNGNLFEVWENGDIAVTAIYTWSTE